jgi:hypothetical protein
VAISTPETFTSASHLKGVHDSIDENIRLTPMTLSLPLGAHTHAEVRG